MSLYSKHYWKIEKYKQNFESLLEYIKQMDDSEEKTELAISAANYFVYKNTGYYTSSFLENYFTEYARKIKVDLSGIQYQKNSVLHVLTSGFETGGHTRVVERWIENAPSSQKHSVIQTRPSNAKLITLQNNIKAKNGEYILFDNSLTLREKAVKLRKKAMEYEYVILHTHMEDTTAIAAFGTEDFTRPVLLYNHASHMPWLGKSIADLVLDIQNNDEITKEKRGITNTYFLGVPSKKISLSVSDKTEIRKKLNLPLDKQIIVTSGSEFRYRKIGDKSFVDYLSDIMNNNTICYVIGVYPNNYVWKKEMKKSGKNINLLGHINFDEGFSDYLKAADLYLDSYPLQGGTAVIDAISSGTPCLSLKTILPQFDYLIQTSAYCNTEEEFISKAKKVLEDKEYAQNLWEELKTSLIKNQSIEAWNNKTEKLYKIAPKSHTVKDLTGVKDYSEPNELSFLCNVLYDKKFLKLKNIESVTYNTIDEKFKYGNIYKKFGIPFLFEVISSKKDQYKYKTIKLFNISVYTYKKEL